MMPVLAGPRLAVSRRVAVIIAFHRRHIAAAVAVEVIGAPCGSHGAQRLSQAIHQCAGETAFRRGQCDLIILTEIDLTDRASRGIYPCKSCNLSVVWHQIAMTLQDLPGFGTMEAASGAIFDAVTTIVMGLPARGGLLLLHGSNPYPGVHRSGAWFCADRFSLPDKDRTADGLTRPLQSSPVRHPQQEQKMTVMDIIEKNMVYTLLRDTLYAYIQDEALTRGAAISYYTVTSLGPVLVIVVAIAGMAFGQEAAQGAIVQQLAGLTGQESAQLAQSTLKGAAGLSSGLIAGAVGLIALLVTASGVFVEMQTALNVIWRAEPKGDTITRMIRARAASLGLVATLGFLLLVSLVISAILSAIGAYIDRVIPFGHVILRIIYLAVSFSLIATMFAAIYKVLPDSDIAWQDVRLGAIVTAILFTIGKYLISLYIGSSTIVTSYGAAASVIVMLLWLYYSAQIFLIGAEFTKVYALRRGSRSGQAAPS
jgi:membrane protein